MRTRRSWLFLSLICLSALLLLAVSRQTYKEDISDFLPLNNKYHQALKVYQKISGAEKILVVFEGTEPDAITQAIDSFVYRLQQNDKEGMIRDLTCQIDMERITETTGFLYRHMPYFLTEKDYARFDSLLSQEDYIPTQLAQDKQLLMFPVSGLLSDNFLRDPLNLFTPVVAQLQQTQPSVNYENYDGYIFSPDMKRGIVVLTSPFGASETEQNARLLQLLQRTADKLESQVDIRFTGGPVIAVGNSNQIKTDSLLSVFLAITLIVLLLFYAFRNLRNLLLIVLSIAWGWLFAMGALSFIHDGVSVIVIGISSIILGIAVNYPLHLIAHTRHTPDIKSALKEIVMPLVVGNITTVGAFLALVPLKSVALRDLGLFSAFLLIGTILFVLFYLPHLIKTKPQQAEEKVLSRMSSLKLENKRWLVLAIVVLTPLFAYYSLDTTFDTNMSHINYMTAEQKEDLAYLQTLASTNDTCQNVYIVSTDTFMDHALTKSSEIQLALDSLKHVGLIAGTQGCSQFLCPTDEQQKRLALWDAFVTKYGNKLETAITAAAREEGFAEDAFDAFFQLLHTSFKPQGNSFFKPLTSTVFASNVITDSLAQTYHVIDVVKTDATKVNEVIQTVEQAVNGIYAFDVASMNSSIATRLSDDFNYIGWACGLIVFLFLWFSLGSIELAILSFLPMALSWVWILGIMGMMGLSFNVVNVILATFIFGQGDDYTIFMTEGCQYEYAYQRKMLASYKNSIIISALIMFIGIGTLIFAKHPALHALAQVTIVGMFSVVLMAFVLPPLIFRWLVADKHGYRRRPVTLASLLGLRRADDNISLVRDIYRYRGIEISTAVNRSLKKHKNRESQEPVPTMIRNTGWGEIALLTALEHPDISIVAVEPDEERRLVAQHAAEVAAPNLTFIETDHCKDI